MRRALLLCAALALTGCPRGGIGEECNPDGTCNGPALSCQKTAINLWDFVPAYHCLLTEESPDGGAPSPKETTL